MRPAGMPATKGASEPARKRAQAGGIEASAGSDDEAGPSSARNRRSSPNAPSAAADIGSPAKLQKASTAAQDKSEGIARQAGRADGSGADSSDGDEEGEVKATKEKGTSSKEMTEMKQQLLAIKAELEKTKQAAAVAQNAANPAAAAAQMPSAGPAAPSMRTMAGPAALTAASPGHAVNEPASCSVLVNKIPVGISKEQIIAHFQ